MKRERLDVEVTVRRVEDYVEVKLHGWPYGDYTEYPYALMTPAETIKLITRLTQVLTTVSKRLLREASEQGEGKKQ
jgi:hypothetical protein